LKSQFRPEFLNRIDEVVIFNGLTIEEITKIVDVQIDLLKARLAERNIDLTLSDAARDLLALEGFDPVYGARPLKRVIEKKIQNELAVRLLDGTITEAGSVLVEIEGGRIAFRFTPADKAASGP
jgi:ATP-dependent Clp protease ATP-binding subunit ClpB